jgi:hypothetical protein
MFLKKDGIINTVAVDTFKLAARGAFLAGVAAKSSIKVTNAGGALQLGRVSVVGLRAGGWV